MNIALRISIMVLVILVGLAIGSFLNVVIYRLPRDMSLSKPGSHCPKCNNRIKWYDNIPVLSFLILRGKCRHCHEKISFRYPAVELFTAIIFFLCLTLFTNVVIPSMGANWVKFGVSLVACSALIAIFGCDLDTMLIPDSLQFVLLACGLVLLLDDPSFNNILMKIIGFFGAGLLFYLVAFIYKSIHKKEGLGFGDIELVAVGGLLLGGPQMIYALLIACVFGGIILLILFFVNKNKEKEYPFGVFLTSGILIALFSGEYVVNWYLSLLGVK